MEHFFSPKSSGDLRSDAHQSQIIGGDTDEDHTQTIKGDTVKLLQEIYSPPSRVSTPLTANLNSRVTCSKKEQCTSTFYFLKILKPIVAVNINVYPPTTSRALQVI